MKRITYWQHAAWLMVFAFCCICANNSTAGSITFKNTLSGNQLAKDSLVTVTDTVFFSSSLASKLNKPYPVQDLVTFRLNEVSSVYLPASFTASISVRIYYTKSDLSVDSVDKTFTINYDSTQANTYTARNSVSFTGGYSVKVKVLSNVAITPSLSVADALIIENQVTAQPDYIFTCTNNVVKSVSISSFAVDSTGDEVKVSWGSILGATEYDLEWAYMDSSTLARGVDTLHPNTSIFNNNATRVTVSTTSYNIPLMYDNKGRLFVRVRAVKAIQGASRMETSWSSDYLPAGLGKLYYNGHADSLNWQSTITFAEDGKRKVITQYYDGSLRSRQTVTKDNSTGTTVVAETFYDYQGRPVIQVMPAPTIDKIIHYTANFNTKLGGAEYDKDSYDYFTAGNFCVAGAAQMDTISGAAKYYSPANPNKASGIHRFIPDAQGFAFTETEYTQDNTGRINRQSGVGPTFKLSNGHETKYYYSTPDQDELDALFGTEVGDHSHYFKTAVQDANGQFSVSYTDMHGRTVATALAGPVPKSLDKLPNNDTTNIPSITETIADLSTNVTTGLVMQSQKSLLVTKQDDYLFKYDLNPDSLRKKDCSNATVCYGCLYNLEITISDNCNNENLPGDKLFDTVITKFTLDSMSYYAASCNKPQGFHFQFTKNLLPGAYLVTKKLSVNKQASDYYRDSVFMARNTCISQDSMIRLQMKLQLRSNCYGTPLSDTSSGDYEDTRTAMLLDMTAPSGQYANLAQKSDPLSIFYVKPLTNAPAPYQVPYTPYLDEAGNTDKVYDDSTATYVLPGQLDAAQFVDKFKASWASSLLPYHREYCKLQQYQGFQNSFIWDRKFEKCDTYAEAVTKGFLNPTGNTTTQFTHYAAVNATYKDPLATISSGAYKAKLDGKIQADTISTLGGTNYPVTLWVMSTLAVSCGVDATCQTNLIQTNTAFADASLTTGELDMAWRNFRENYLGIKHHIIDSLIALNCTDKTDSILLFGHTLNFNTPQNALTQNGLGYLNTLTAAGKITSQNNVKLAIAQQRDSTCWWYAKVWAQQLAPCKYPVDSVNNVIIPKLVKVCQKGYDVNHPLGSRDISPDSSNTFTSFDAVINNYNSTHGITTNWACNADLITAPPPFKNQVVYASKPIWSKPDSCECGKISSLYTEFNANKTADDNNSFSKYLLRKYQTSATDDDLNILMNQCSISHGGKTVFPANYLAKPVNLSPIFQCYSGDVCVSCLQVNNLYSQYMNAYPTAAPGWATDDSLQLAKNTFFANYMNNRLGFSKGAADYLNFMQACNLALVDSTNTASPYSCSQLKTTVNNYTAVGGYVPKLDSLGYGLDTSHWKVDFGGWDYTAGVPLKAIFKNGIAQLPPSYISSLMSNPSGQREVAFDYYNDTVCVPQSFTFELKLKLPDNLIDTGSQNWSKSSWWIWLYTNNADYTGQSGVLASFHPDSPGVAVCTSMFINGQQCVADNVPGVHMNNWTTLKFRFSGTQFNLLVNDTVRATRTLSFPVTQLYTWSLSQQSLYGQIDYIKIYDSANNMLYNEDFWDSARIAYPTLAAKKCTDDCSRRFTSYFNYARSSNYTAAQISNFYLQACDTALNVCSNANLMLCGKSDPVFGPVTDSLSNCTDSTFFAVSAGIELFKVYTDSLKNNFDSAYNAKCLQAYKYESFTVTHKENEYHFTLYYYDQAGNLVKTVPPAGVRYNFRQTWFDSVTNARSSDVLLTPAHTLETNYRYNSLNQVIASKTPDAGLSTYYYDRLGRLALSQNSKQAAANPDNWSYTNYDVLGRINEVGELATNTAMTTVKSRTPAQLTSWLNATWTTRRQVTKTYYDKPYIASLAPYTTQRNLRNRVSWAAVYDTAANVDNLVQFSTATFYTYDAHGDVDTLLQDYGNSVYKPNVMNRNGNRFKKIVYRFDLVSGKVNSVAYQPNMPDAFYHNYTYDAENRLTSVQTSNDSVYWETEASYSYYKHGYLARTVLGQVQVQGIDYAYTLQGWLKGINSSANYKNYDMGYDGSSYTATAKDAYALSIYHFNNKGVDVVGNPYNNASYPANEYIPIYTPNVRPFVTLQSADTSFKPLYDGNIAAISVNVPKVGTPYLYNYRYDQLNRLTGMQSYTGLVDTVNSWNNLAATKDYQEQASYDPNGNLLTYNRYANAAQLMDSLKYNYIANSNKLDHIDDFANTPGLPTDLEDQGNSNYKYDNIGNLVRDSTGGLDTVYWNVYGKMIQIKKHDGFVIKYSYDVAGNRVSKILTKDLASEHDTTLTWYVRDAAGNIMSIYTAGNYAPIGEFLANGGQLTQAEVSLYGSARVGIFKPSTNIQVITAPIKIKIRGLDSGYVITFIRGKKFFELSNHLGNVMATIVDRKIGLQSGSVVSYYLPVISSAQDYAPFGSVLSNRQYSSGYQYKYAFNDKEKDNDIEGNGVDFDYGARIYDARIGRFLSVDPLTSKYAFLTPYQYASNKPVWKRDVDGLEEEGEEEEAKEDDGEQIREIIRRNIERENEEKEKEEEELLKKNPIFRDLQARARAALNGVRSAYQQYTNGAIIRMQNSFGGVNPGMTPVTEFVDENGNTIQVDGDKSDAWLAHQEKVATELQKNNPGAQFGKQVTLDVYNKDGRMVTIISDVLYSKGGTYTITDAKNSTRNDLVNASEEKIFNACTDNQKLGYTWITQGQVSQVVPRGGNAAAMNLPVGQPIQVSPVIQIAVNIPVNTGVYANPGGVYYRNFQVPQTPPAATGHK